MIVNCVSCARLMLFSHENSIESFDAIISKQCELKILEVFVKFSTQKDISVYTSVFDKNSGTCSFSDL